MKRFFVLLVLLAPFARGADDMPATCFQTYSPWSETTDLGGEMAIVYAVTEDFPERLKSWQEQGYRVAMMTGISWGGYGAYYQTDIGLKTAEIQTRKNGELFMHGNSTDVGYNVPTPPYVEFIQRYVEPAVRPGMWGVFLEEPEFWANAGWSQAFRDEWQRYYGEPWQEPDSSVDAQYRASRLKYEMYFRALQETFRHAKAKASEQGFEVQCIVPTHSMINYAQWRIVSPESSLAQVPECDGYIAQVWTGTSRTPNMYRGVSRERTFETAYFEYGQMLAMVRPTGRKLWFLHDPIEDNPNHSWQDYEVNYEATVAASLFWPEVSSYEVMPWPDRIFEREYAGPDGTPIALPPDYGAQLIALVNVLGEMHRHPTPSPGSGLGVIVSDTMMFQRAAPHPSDPQLGSFFSLAMPLVKHGLMPHVVQLENVVHKDSLKDYKTLLLTYEGQKPMKPEYHDAIAAWVRAGGGLIFVEDGSDLYHNARAWWNEEGGNSNKAYQDLFEKLGIENHAFNEPMQVGEGWVRVFSEKPRALQRYAYGAEKVIELVSEMAAKQGEALSLRNHMLLRRGPYVVAAVLDESVDDKPLSLPGQYVDLFDGRLPILQKPDVAVGERCLLYDLAWAREHERVLLAASARVKDLENTGDRVYMKVRGPQKVPGRARLLLARAPSAATIDGQAATHHWDPASSTLLVEWENQARWQDLEVAISPELR